MNREPPQRQINMQLLIWILAGGWAILRGWSLGWTWLIIVGVVCIAIGVGLFGLHWSDRLRKWEQTINVTLLIVVVLALIVVFTMDVLR